MIKCILVSFMLSGIFLHAQAQEIPQKLKQAKWVRIMSADSLYNFFEADAEFQKYHTAYLKEKKKEEKRRTVNPSHAEEEHMKSPLELLISKYVNWSITIQPFVLSDGKIMPLSKRLEVMNDARAKQKEEQIQQ